MIATIMQVSISWDKAYKAASTTGDIISPQGSTPQSTLSLSQLDEYGYNDGGVYELRTNHEIQNFIVAGSWTFLVECREGLYDAEDAAPDDFKVLGAWDYYTGEPMGGVGSPWFLTNKQELMKYMPNGVIEDVWLMEGQAPRAFV